MTYKKFRQDFYNELAPHDFHAYMLRHYFAQELYQEIVGVTAPVNKVKSGRGKHHIQDIANQHSIAYKEAKLLDKKARKLVATNLGHSRENISNNYLGK